MLGVNVYLAVTYLNLVAVNMFRNLQWEQDKHMITFAVGTGPTHADICSRNRTRVDI